MYSSFLVLILKVLKERGEKRILGKKRLVLASLDFESKIAMHWPFLRASRVALQVCFSILCV
jgi:hypothetical protein